VDGHPVDPLLDVIVFLQMAHEYDRCNAELLSDLQQVGQRERSLFDDLHAAGSEALTGFWALETPVPEDPGATMTAERIAAWTRLMLDDDRRPGLFLTTSPAVLDFIKEGAPDLEPVFAVDISRQPVAGEAESDTARKRLADLLARLTSGAPVDDGSNGNGMLSDGEGGPLIVHVAHGVPPAGFFARFAGPHLTEDSRVKSSPTPPNTVICLFDTT
jgi:hypothetical protein